MSSTFQVVINHIDSFYPQRDNDIECELCFGAHSTDSCTVPVDVLIPRREAIIRAQRIFENAMHIAQPIIDQYANIRNEHNNRINRINNINSLYDLEYILPNITIHKQELKADTIECAICFEDVPKLEACKFQCNHNYCKSCTIENIKHNIRNRKPHNCPSCRTEIDTIYEFK